MAYCFANGAELSAEPRDVYVIDSKSGREFRGVVEDVDFEDGLVLVQVADKSWIETHPQLSQTNGLAWFEVSLVRPA